jgi:hypothetical protein
LAYPLTRTRSTLVRFLVILSSLVPFAFFSNSDIHSKI